LSTLPFGEGALKERWWRRMRIRRRRLFS